MVKLKKNSQNKPINQNEFKKLDIWDEQIDDKIDIKYAT